MSNPLDHPYSRGHEVSKLILDPHEVSKLIEEVIHAILPRLVRDELRKIMQDGAADMAENIITGLLRKGLQREGLIRGTIHDYSATENVGGAKANDNPKPR